MKATHLITVLATVVSLCSCAAKREVPFRAGPGEPFTGKLARYDYSTYAKIPDTPTCWVYRRAAKIFPFISKKAFYGNWAGSGNSGGPPKDHMDEIYRRHDIAYAECSALPLLKLADKICVEALHRMDKSGLSPEGMDFYKRSSSFFSNPRLTLVGKPVSAYWRAKERKDCPFQTEQDFRELFQLPPVPEPAAAPAAGKSQTVKTKAKKTSAMVKSPPARAARELAAQR